MPAKNLSTGQLADMAINEIEVRNFMSDVNKPIIDYFSVHNDLESLTTAMKFARKFQVKTGEWDMSAVKYHFNNRFNEISKLMRSNIHKKF